MKKCIETVLVAKICYIIIIYNFLFKTYFRDKVKLYIKTAINYLLKKNM